MIHLYPANRLEDLALLFNKLTEQNAGWLLAGDIVLVQNQGMQHWLNMKVAEQRGIAMNIDYQLPARFFWSVIRQTLGAERVPETSPYSREVLSWRLYQLLADDDFMAHPLSDEATRYWQQGQHPHIQDLRRFQLAKELADLFEQYLIYRPDWIHEWQQGTQPHWQAVLWQYLANDIPEHPLMLMQQAQQSLAQATDLPDRICLFGLNALPPLWLNFLAQLSEHMEIHFFHLNPCVEFWGELPSDRQLAKWLDADPEQLLDQGNPLLANLGMQGKEFLSLLQETEASEIPLYISPLATQDDTSPSQGSVLAHLQQDILTLNDARQQPSSLQDESIVIRSAHSALREVQALHDWLLHQFNNDPTLTPKDVLVMCPQVEDYAPYVEAVFARGWDELSSTMPPLPCSIADRNIRDADPVIDAFLRLLTLPDSRFAVTEIIDYLRLAPVQRHFALTDDTLDTLSQWLHRAAVHWGLNAEHKHQLLNAPSNDHFTWQQGLERLLLGFAHSDQEQAYHSRWLLADVEGDDAITLGQIIALLQQLRHFAEHLQHPRTSTDWATLLRDLIGNIFGELSEEPQSAQWLEDAIEALLEHCTAAQLTGPLPLSVIREYLEQSFAGTDTSSQFLTGQITFCSMMPMRSIPFKVIAVLGLNNGDFPRQRTPLGFDLMGHDAGRRGDRSRRADDRYLFLEAMISAREILYLSYQGHDIRTNTPREPSLVLKELFDYLERGYGWPIEEGTGPAVQQVPMQPFSPANYAPPHNSFDQAWLSLISPRPAPASSAESALIAADLIPVDNTISLEQWVRFFDNPLRGFAEQQLGLFLDQQPGPMLSDAEPFTASNLDRYQLQQQLIHCYLEQGDPSPLLDQALLMGHLPDSIQTQDLLTEWQQDAETFAQQLQQQQVPTLSPMLASYDLTTPEGKVRLQGELPCSEQQQIFWRLANIKAKDKLRLWFHHLLACCQTPVTTYGWFRATAKNKDIACYSLAPVDTPEHYLRQWWDAYQQALRTPQLWHGELGFALPPEEDKVSDKLTKKWRDDYNQRGLAYDPYTQYFYPEDPLWSTSLIAQLRELYDPINQLMQAQEFAL